MSRKKRADPEWQPPPSYAWDSDEAKAIKVLHRVVDRMSAFFAIWRRKSDGAVSFRKEMTEQLKAFAKAGDESTWVTLNYQQATSWEELLGKVFEPGMIRKHLVEGSRAPWPWPPSLEGKIYPDPNGVPPLGDADRNALASEGQR